MSAVFSAELSAVSASEAALPEPSSAFISSVSTVSVIAAKVEFCIVCAAALNVSVPAAFSKVLCKDLSNWI
ncbi:MAG: hypothetical protein SP4CHLAM5_01690 [Chlamydiia bacterium]|nr:hypothetical protein [Chlamydiia bacterium]